MSNATFDRPDLTTFTRLDELGLEVVGQRREPDRTVLECRVVEPDQWCRRCGCEGSPRDSVTRRLAHEPFGWRPTVLQIRVRRYRCTGCGHVWRQDTSQAANARSKLSRRALQWALCGIVVQHLTVARVAEALAVSWNTANTAVLAEGKRVLIDDPTRFDGVRIIGVDEHVWRHTRRGVYTSIAFTDRLVDEGIDPSVGSVGYAYDNSLAESQIGLYKSELIHHEGPWRDVDQVEAATASWVLWFNTERTHGSIYDLTPLEVEQLDYARNEPVERAG
ncbi:MAG: transposase [Microbacteriaceae bacterium]|nr:transposase [Microbacteriaceae bacterium]